MIASRAALFRTAVSIGSRRSGGNCGGLPSASQRWMSAIVPPSKKSETDADETSQSTTTLQRRSLHQSAKKEQSDAATTTTMVFEKPVTSSATSALANRWIVTAEVAVSKIFPAGFGWQTASVLAGDAGLTNLNFALATGLGDAVGVLGGHCLFYAAKKAVTKNENINMMRELHTGILLGSAAFCSGTAWQPVVNALQGADLSFGSVMAGTWLVCGTAFYAGLRIGRTLLPLSYVEKPTYENSQTDVALSTAIGGATGFFVGTDAVYLPEQNWLLPAVGIVEGTPDVVGCALAGTSTSLGFLSTQSFLNTVFPHGKSWND